MLNQEIAFNSLQFGVEQPPGSTNIVDIKIAGSSISAIVGPTPLVDISKVFENEDGFISSITDNISLNGKIVAMEIYGLKPITEKIQDLENLFKCSMTTLEIFCDDDIVYSKSGVMIKNVNINKTDNNWTRTADFSIELESRTNASGEIQTVRERSETWNIEPIEDVQFMSANIGVVQLPEYLNPGLLPSPATRSNGQPQTNVNASQNTSSTLGLSNVGQYRITRKLSARGLITPKDNDSCLNYSREETNRIKVSNAKTWVEDTADSIVGLSGSLYFPDLLSTNAGTGIKFYNHIRSISTDFYNGSYEMSDTWIAMPTGTTHTESFTLDCSSAENFSKTVRVVGNVKGLSMYDHQKKSNHKFINSNDPENSPYVLNLDMANKNFDKDGPVNVLVNSVVPAVASKVNQISGDKYTNAKNAWENIIKPYSYRRACLAMSQQGKSLRQPTNEIDPNTPENPSFFVDRPLNAVPSSTSEGHDPYTGVISYTYEFNNKYKAIPGTLSENINVTHDFPSDVITEVPILGRRLGPILQSFGKSNASKTLNIDLIVQPPQSTAGSIPNNLHCPVGLGTDLRNYINKIIEGHAPFYGSDESLFGSASKNNVTGNAIGAVGIAALPGTVFVRTNQETWNPTDGRFSKTITWTYQQCDVSRHPLNY